LDLQPIGKHTNLNVATPDVGAVITVGNGVAKCLTQSFERIFREFTAKYSMDENRLAHGSEDIVFRLLDHLKNRAFKPAAIRKSGTLRCLLLWSRTVVLNKSDHELG
jgi:hypothetical protein